VEEIVAHAAVSAEDEVVVIEEDEEDFQEVVDEVSLTSPRSSDSQEVENPGCGAPCLRARAKVIRPRVADRRVRRSRR
jgi:division protein CdvB (Snf7/Vps24/ESCRT-III family)